MWNSRILVALFVALMTTMFVDQYLLQGEDANAITWAQSANETEDLELLAWQQGRFANLGFTDSYLHFRLPIPALPESSDEDRHITVSPTYIDKIVVSFMAENGKIIEQQVKGDKHGDTLLSYSRDIDQFVFKVPAQVVSAHLVLSSTSNLRATIDLVTEDALFFNIIQSLLIKIAVFMFLAVAVVVGAVVWVSLRTGVYLWFAAYMAAWMALLTGFSNVLVVLDKRLLGFNDALVSWGAIWASIFGFAFFFQILRLIMRPNWLLKTLYVMGFVVLANFFVYLFIDERLALSLNILSLLIATVLILSTLPFVQGKDHLATYVVKKVRLPFVLLMLFVLVSSVAGLGQGTAYSLNYLHATFTVFFNAYFLWIWFSIQSRQNAARVLKGRSLELVNNQLNKQLEEQRTLFAMLFHEIKTPLTSLKFILYGWSKKPQADVQIDNVSHVLEQIEVMHMLEQSHQKVEDIALLSLVNDNWGQLADHAIGPINMRLHARGNTHVVGNQFLLHTVIKNLLDNAIKYNTGTHVQVLLYGAADKCYLRVQNTMSNISHDDLAKTTDKYWRGKVNSGIRGTGLGLWLVKNLCALANINMQLSTRKGRFIVTLELPYA